jgi:hypothetical protein
MKRSRFTMLAMLLVVTGCRSDDRAEPLFEVTSSRSSWPDPTSTSVRRGSLRMRPRISTPVGLSRRGQLRLATPCITALVACTEVAEYCVGSWASDARFMGAERPVLRALYSEPNERDVWIGCGTLSPFFWFPCCS